MEKWRYIGELKNNQRNGSGILTKANGENYFGEWINYQITGKGCYTFTDGT